MCNVGEHPHPLAHKNLLPVQFTYPAASKTDTTKSTPICPSCSREISNATKSILLTSKRPANETTDEPAPAKRAKKDKKEKEDVVCGHVVCSTCADTIVKPGKQCPVCEAHIRPDKDMIELGREGESYCATLLVEGVLILHALGTGFAAAGGAQAKREGVAFMP